MQVPRNIIGFRRFRDSQGVTATLGVMMALVLCSFPTVFIYCSLADPSPQNPALKFLAFLFSACSVCLGLLIFSGTLPALQCSREITQVLKQDLPALIINREGIWDYSSSHIFGFVSWEEIETVMIDSWYSPKVDKHWVGIAFVAKNKDILLRRKPTIARFWLNKETGIVDRRQIFISQEWLDVPVKELIRQIEDLRAKQQS